MNSPEFQRRALALFDELVELAPAQREARLRSLADEEPAMHAEVVALLAADSEEGVFAHGPATLLAADGFDAPDADDALLEQRIGPWRIVGIIGHGGMGTVYRGERVEGGFQQEAAVKLIRMGLDQPALRQRFLRERQILARLQHPNIAALLDGGVSDAGAPYFAMELVDGEAIDHWCDAHALGLRERVRLFLQVCGAVQHAHQNLVVHRDLKPGNILVTTGGQAKLLDFGIAKLLQGDTEGVATRDRVLTPEFAAPEQLNGDAITTATDVYALGIVLYRLLAGGSPFPNATAAMLATSEPETLSRTALRGGEDTAQARGTDARRLAAALRGDLDAIVRRCLQREPARRYPSAEALANDLRAWLDGRPVSAVRGDRAYRLRKFVERNRWGVAAATAAVLALLALVASSQWQQRRTEQARALAEQARLTAEQERTRAERTTSFVLSLFDEQDPLRRALAQARPAKALVAEGLSRVDSELAGQPELQAELLADLGSVEINLGELQPAAQVLQRAFALQSRLHGARSTQAARVEALLARAEVQTGQLPEASARMARVLPQLEHALGADHPDVVLLRRAHLRVLVNDSRFEDAEAESRRVVDSTTRLRGRDHPETAMALTVRGMTLVALGRLQEAVAVNRDAIARLEHAGGDSSSMLIYPLLQLGSAQFGLGDDAGVIATQGRVIKIAETSLGPQHPLLGAAYSSRGNSLRRLGRLDEAERDFARAEPILEPLGTPELAQLWEFRGQLAMARHQSAAAERLLNDAAKLYAQRLGETATDTWEARSERGTALVLLGRVAEGEALQREALAAVAKLSGEQSAAWSELARTLADTLRRSGRATEAAALEARAKPQNQ